MSCAAQRVIGGTGKTVGVITDGARPLCCGRTYLSAGLVERARAEMTRTAEAFRTALDQGKTIVGLEPSCTLMFRDEAVNLLPDWSAEMGARVLTFAEYLARNPVAATLPDTRVMVHGHCHQKAMGVAGATLDALNGIEGVAAQMIDSSCCGMAGPFGYQAETEQVSREMAELSLAPAIRAAPEAVVVADGFSCRCQIRDVTDRHALSLARFLDQAMTTGGSAQ